MKSTLVPLVFIAALGASPGCVTSKDPDVKLNAAPDEDPDYAVALDKATKKREVLKDFETRYIVTATYLSPEFRAAFGRRLAEVYQEKGEGHVFTEANSKAAFFVSLHVGEEERSDLSNPQHWTLLMGSKDGPLKPVLVKRLRDKERWRAFFPAVSEWTQDFLVIFDAPSVNANSPALVEKTSVELTLANADGKVDLTW